MSDLKKIIKYRIDQTSDNETLKLILEVIERKEKLAAIVDKLKSPTGDAIELLSRDEPSLEQFADAIDFDTLSSIEFDEDIDLQKEVERLFSDTSNLEKEYKELK